MRACPGRSSLRPLAALCAALSLASTAGASEIRFQTRFSGVPAYTDGASLRTLVEGLMAAAPGAGYCDATPAAWNALSNQATCPGGIGGNVAFDISATFGVDAALAGSWTFRAGVDFGLGGALFVDGVEVDFRSTDMWWNGSYGNPTQFLTATVVLGAGNHVIEAYGFDACCDGLQQAQFLAPNAPGFVTFGAGDGLDPLRVPAPSPGLLLAAGLAAAWVSRRR